MLQRDGKAQGAIALDELLGEGRRLVRGVIEQLNLQLGTGVVQMHHGLDQPLDDVALVVERQLHGHARVPRCPGLPGLLHGGFVLEHPAPDTAVQEEQDVAIHAIEEKTAGGQAMEQ